jgi:hypothetical protein
LNDLLTDKNITIRSYNWKENREKSESVEVKRLKGKNNGERQVRKKGKKMDKRGEK